VFLFENGDVNKGYGRQPELKYETAMRAMSEMGYLAANIGEEDLVLGADYLAYVADFAGVPLLSANIVDSDGEAVFQEFLMRTTSPGGVPVTAAAIGVISTEFKERIETLNPGLCVEEYGPKLEELVEQLRGQADLLIVLAHMSDEEAQAVAARFPRINLIIASHSGDDPFPAPLLADGVPILFSGTKGMHVGRAAFRLGTEGAKFEGYSAEKLDGTVDDSQAMLALIEGYQHMVRAENLLEESPKTEHAEANFAGNRSCLRCHSLSSYRFRKDKHAHAFEPLVDKGHHYDPECVGCHTVGFSYVTGFVSSDTTPELENVGCENCHGPGSNHIDDPKQHQYERVEKEVCESCHNPENSPKFVYEERLKEIRHNSIFLCSANICHWLD
jgi:hypothetical protein